MPTSSPISAADYFQPSGIGCLRPRVLVAGASGFVGGAVVDALARAGWETHALLRSGSSPRAPWFDGWEGVQCHLWSGSAESLPALVKDAAPDIVVHLAAMTVGEHASADLVPLIQANLQFGLQLVDACMRNGVTRFVNTGSIWQHGIGPHDRGTVNLYASTKQAFETMLEWYHRVHGLSCTTLLLGDTYGPGDPRNKLVPLLLRCLEEGTPLALSPGEQIVDICHVDDVAQAYVAACAGLLPAQVPANHRHHVSGAQLTVRSLVRAFEQACSSALPITWGARPYRRREVMRPSWGDSLPMPGWAPRIPLDEGLAKLLRVQA